MIAVGFDTICGYFSKGADEMEILGIFYGSVIAIGYGMFFYHNRPGAKH